MCSTVATEVLCCLYIKNLYIKKRFFYSLSCPFVLFFPLAVLCLAQSKIIIKYSAISIRQLLQFIPKLMIRVAIFKKLRLENKSVCLFETRPIVYGHSNKNIGNCSVLPHIVSCIYQRHHMFVQYYFKYILVQCPSQFM